MLIAEYSLYCGNQTKVTGTRERFRPASFQEIAIMKILQIKELTQATVVCGNTRLEQGLDCAFASDLMSDVLTLDCSAVLMITGLCNPQTIRTAEMAEIACILFVRGKKVSSEMKQLAEENDIVLLETELSMYRVAGILFANGLKLVY